MSYLVMVGGVLGGVRVHARGRDEIANAEAEVLAEFRRALARSGKARTCEGFSVAIHVLPDCEHDHEGGT